MTDNELSTVIDWMSQEVVAWEEYFPERADALARLAVVAGRLGQADHAGVLIEKAASNLLGYGWRKDITLHTALELIATAHRANLRDTWPLLQQAAPLVEAVQDATDGDETRHLPVLLFDIVQEIMPSRAPHYLLHLSKNEDWYDLEQCLRSYLQQVDLADAAVRALGRTASTDGTINAFANAWNQWIDNDCPNAMRPSERASYERWFETVRGEEEAIENQRDESGPEIDANELPDEGPQSAAELLEQIETNNLLRGFGRARQIVYRVDEWFGTSRHSPRAEELDALRRVADAWLERAGDFDYEVSDALWKACLLHGERERAFQLLVLAQAQGRGWTRYWTSAERSEERQQAVLEHYPERARRFVIESLGRSGFKYGIGEPSVVVGFLCRAEMTDVARQLVDGRWQHVLSLFPDYPLPTCQWTNEDANDVTATDILFSRLDHPEVFVRLQAARELVQLNDADEVVARLQMKISNATHECECLGPWLALLMVLREHAAHGQHVEAALRQWRDDGGAITRFLAGEALRLIGNNEASRRGSEGVDLELVDVPQWFMDLVEQPPLSREVTAWGDQHRDLLVAHLYAHARDLGITRNRIYRLTRADRYMRSTEGCFCPHESNLSELLQSCYSRAIDSVTAAISGQDRVGDERPALAVPFDVSFAQLDVRPRPSWVPEPEPLESYPSGRIESLRLIEWDQVLSASSDGDCMLFGCDLAVRHSASQEHTRVLPFLYRWDGAQAPEPADVFRYLSEFWCARTRAGIWEYDSLDSELNGRAPQTPSQLSDLIVYAILAEHRCWIRRWHALQAYFRPYLLLPGTPFSRGLSPPEVYRDWSYCRTDAGPSVINGFYWQFEGPRRIHSELGMSGGFILWADNTWMSEMQDRLNLRLAWVRRTQLRYAGRSARETAAEDTSYFFHGLSPVILP